MELRVLELVLEAERAASEARHRHDPPAYVVIEQEPRRGRWQALVGGIGALLAVVVGVGGR